jgi:3-deoxy-D-manno-octulosonic-acid transferase
MRSDEDARRIIALGAPAERVFVSGDLKNEAPADEPQGADMWRRLLGLPAGAPVWVAGSTHRGEEDIVAEVQSRLRAFWPGLVLIVAPRHPERVEDVERVLRARGMVTVRRSGLPHAGREGAVVVLDTVGELARLYQVADVVFVGGSLVPAGGHNMLEPARRRKPVVFGPHTENFRESADFLVEAGAALRVPDGEGLIRVLGRLLADPVLRAKMGEAAHAAVSARQGAVRGTLELVDRFLYREGVAGG